MGKKRVKTFASAAIRSASNSSTARRRGSRRGMRRLRLLKNEKSFTEINVGKTTLVTPNCLCTRLWDKNAKIRNLRVSQCNNQLDLLLWFQILPSSTSITLPNRRIRRNSSRLSQSRPAQTCLQLGPCWQIQGVEHFVTVLSSGPHLGLGFFLSGLSSLKIDLKISVLAEANTIAATYYAKFGAVLKLVPSTVFSNLWNAVQDLTFGHQSAMAQAK